MSIVTRIMLAAASFALAGQSVPAPERGAYQALQEGDYLGAVDLARGAASKGGSVDRTSPAYGDWLQIHPFIGGVLDPAAIEPGPYSGTLDAERAARFRSAEARDAVREIAARAAHARIVILNEAHNSPRDRAFALEVARALRPLGYRLLAMEALSNHPDPAATSNGWPCGSSA